MMRASVLCWSTVWRPTVSAWSCRCTNAILPNGEHVFPPWLMTSCRFKSSSSMFSARYASWTASHVWLAECWNILQAIPDTDAQGTDFRIMRLTSCEDALRVAIDTSGGVPLEQFQQSISFTSHQGVGDAKGVHRRAELWFTRWLNLFGFCPSFTL
jgi:hypothetical protein